MSVKTIKDLSVEDVLKLRKEIRLGSLYYDDYKNSFGLDTHSVCDFFDWYLEFLTECEVEEDKKGIPNIEFDYDTEEALSYFFKDVYEEFT